MAMAIVGSALATAGGNILALVAMRKIPGLLAISGVAFVVAGMALGQA